MNQYYNFTGEAISGAIVDALAYNVEMEKITEAFDNFPPAVQFTAGNYNYGEQTTLSSVNYIISVPAIPPAYNYVPGNNAAGLLHVTNTGPATLSVSLNATLPVRIGSAGPAVAGDLREGGIYTFVYDNAQWQTLEMSVRYFGIAESQVGTAQTGAANAAASAATAASWVSPAATSAANAATSAATASTQAGIAVSQVAPAQSSASAASTSSTNAAASATAAGNSATAALVSQSTAAFYQTSATDSASAAAGYAANAADSAADADVYREQAEDAAAEAAGIITAPDFADRVNAIVLELELPVGIVELFAANIDPNADYPGTTWERLPPSVSLQIVAASDAADVLTQVGSDTVTLSNDTMPSHTHNVPQASTNSVALSISLSDTDLGTPTSSNFIDSTHTSDLVQLGGGFIVSDEYTYAPTIPSTGSHAHSLSFYNPPGSGVGTTQVLGGTATQGAQVVNPSFAGDHSHTLTAPNHVHSLYLGPHGHSYNLGAHSHTFNVPAHQHAINLGTHTHTATIGISSTSGGGSPFSVVNSNIKLVAWYRTA